MISCNVNVSNSNLLPFFIMEFPVKCKYRIAFHLPPAIGIRLLFHRLLPHKIMPIAFLCYCIFVLCNSIFMGKERERQRGGKGILGLVLMCKELESATPILTARNY